MWVNRFYNIITGKVVIMANFGTSSRINIGGESLKALQGLVISPIVNSTQYASPPTPNGSEPSTAMTYVNKYRDFAFQKISPPEYGPDGENSTPRITGIPGNQPDYISDTHFIGIMRAIDGLIVHKYVGNISGTGDTPSPFNPQ